QLCQLVLDSLDLNHGPGYGRSYYTGQSRQALLFALDQLAQTNEPATFQRVYDQLMARPSPAKGQRRSFVHNVHDVFQLLSTIHALTHYEQLVTTAEIEAREQDAIIHMPTVLEKRQVVYFWLPAALESITVREIGQLALFSLLTAAIDRRNAREPLHQCY